ncbi:MAG: YbaB/EbfC family nucleoid-associated protein [Patescibacteria group bacterium]
MFEKLKQFKELRDQAKKMQNSLAAETVYQDWRGRIRLVMDGNQRVISLEINPEMLAPEKKNELEKGLAECFNEGVKKAQMAAARKMQSLGGLGGMNLPGFGG